MRHTIRPMKRNDLHQRAQRHHVALGVARLQLQDVLWMHAEVGIGLCDDLIGAPEAIEVVDVQRSQIHLHGLKDVRDSHALRLGAFTVHFNAHLWHVHCIA